VEINYPESVRFYSVPCASVREIWPWAQPIVTTMVGREYEVYTRLARDLPGIPIIPGIKLSSGVSDPLDEVGWRRVGKSVEAAMRLTGSRICVIEAEGAMLHWRRAPGMSEEQLAVAMAACTSHLPGNDVLDEVWWWPAVQKPEYPKYLAMQRALLVADGRFRLISHRFGWRHSTPASREQIRRHPTRVTQMVLGDPVDIYYIGSRYAKDGWTCEQALTLGGGVYYPGWEFSLETARTIRTLAGR
jgi:hypothetical protein